MPAIIPGANEEYTSLGVSMGTGSDFRAETIYFLVVDRFCQGDPANSFGEDADSDPSRANWFAWWGGDLRGVLSRLDYLRDVGATAVWLTPLFEQNPGVVNPDGKRVAGYHGYSPRDLERIDKHLVDAEKDVRVFYKNDTVFDELVAGLHERGMKLILDVVCNRTAVLDGRGQTSLYGDGSLVADGDLDEESWAYRTFLKGALKRWLDKGVDAMRVATVKDQPPWFWQELVAELRAYRPGLPAFGEWFQGSAWDAGAVEFARASGLSMLDFGWRNALVNTLAHRSTRGFEELSALIDLDVKFRDATELVTFVDNHDLPRFLSLNGDEALFRVALLLTLVGRGVPCIFYGNELNLHVDENRGNDPYNRPMMPHFEPTPLAADIAKLAKLRKRNPAVQKGGMRKKWVDADRYAFTRSWQGSHLLVAVNRSAEPAELGLTGIELPDGVYRDRLGGPSIEVLEGATRVVVPAKGIVVYAVAKDPPEGKVLVDIQVNGIRTEFGQELYIIGGGPELGEWDVERAIKLEYINRTTWGGTIGFTSSVGTNVAYKFVVRNRAGTTLYELGRVHQRWVPQRDVVWRDDWKQP